MARIDRVKRVGAVVDAIQTLQAACASLEAYLQL